MSYPERRWAALSILITAGFMDLLDTTIVNVAIPAIRRSLDASYAAIQWIVAGYLLAFAVGLITGGRLGDIFGRKRVFVIGVVAFGLTSLASGLAESPGMLVGSRVLQGLSAAVMVPQILSFVQVSFPRDEQRKALAIYASVAGVAVMSGPLMAGVLLDVFDFSWRSIFLINVPVSAVVAVAALAVMPESRAPDAPRLDPGGVALVSAALFALVFGVIQGRQLGWPAWVFVLMAASLPLFALFAAYERRVERAGRSPLVSMTLFAQRAFSSGIVVVLVFFSGIVGFFLAFTVFLQLGLGYSPLDSALTTFPSSVGVVIASQVSAKATPRFGRHVLSLGAILMAVAMVGIIWTVDRHGAGLEAWDVRPIIFVFGFGMGLILPSLADAVISGVDERHAGAASGVVNTGIQVGNALGVAIIGVILFSAIGTHAPASARGAEPEVSRGLAALDLPPAVRARTVRQFRTCFVDTARQRDPAGVPASCRRRATAQLPPQAAQRVRRVLATAGRHGRADDFVESIKRALLYPVGVFVATFALLFLLPVGTGRTAPERGDATEGAEPPVAEGIA
ncbi:MAG TPA: MFS transporter [Thermoleophilaceae bacterium]|nr:MFS transporter [Thermoleophilaceae bacterium]